MSQLIAKIARNATGKKTREQLLALVPKPVYDDGRTKQCHKDECDISKIMARFEVTGTISHLEKNEGSYADFSDFDFFEQTQKLTRGREIFDSLPAEVRREFGQNPQAFFTFVNDPANAKELRSKLPALAWPGQQLPPEASPTADHEDAQASANEPTASEKPVEKSTEPTPATPATIPTAE